MHFKISKGSKTFTDLQTLLAEMQRCNVAATKLANELGATNGGRHLSRAHVVAGGISGIKLDSKPNGWKGTHRDYYGYYIPKISKANREISNKIASLPVVSHDDLNAVVGFHEHYKDGRWYTSPALNWGDDYVLLHTSPGCDFTPNADMIEILESEYVKLTAKLNPE